MLSAKRRVWGSARILTYCFLALCAITNVSAQTLGRLTGTITDSSQAAVIGAKVAAVNVATGVRYETTSTGTGTYTFPLLPNGNYSVTCELAGFKTFAQSGIVLEAGGSRAVDIQLEIGEVTETVTVDAARPVLESENSEVAQIVERKTMLDAPLASRRAAMLVRLTGAVSMQQELGGNKLPMFSMAGGRSRMQMWTLDGTSAQAVGTIVSQILFNPPSESIEEFRIIMNHYPADLGRTLGGAIQMTTRSGTNEYHGSLYEFLRNDKLDARTFFARGKDPFRFNIFGGTIGGPILRNRTFFFVNMELNRQRVGRTYAHDDVPHPLDRTGDFSNRADVRVLDPVTKQPFANNIIPASRIDPVAAELINYYPFPNRSDNNITRAPQDNFIGFGTDVQDQEFPTVRLDHNQGQNDRFFFRWSRNNVKIQEPGSYPADLLVADPVARGPNRIDFRATTVGWIHNVTPTLFSDFKFMYHSGINDENNVGVGSGVSGQVGLTGVDPNNFARMSITGYSAIGSTALAGYFDRDFYELIENVAWVRGGHNLKVGVNWRNGGRLDDLAESANLSFTNRATAEGLATFLLGWTSGATVSKSATNTRNTYWSAYIQDDWKVTPKLTLNLGLRWDMDSPPYRIPEEVGNGFDYAKINPVSGTPGVVTFLPFAETGFQPFRHDNNNFGPRFGFAYRMTEKTVVRGAYGIMYAMPWGGAGGWDAGFFPASTFNSPDGGFTPAFLMKDGVPPPPPAEARNDAFGAVPVGTSPRFSPNYWETGHLTPYSQSFNLGIQKQLSNEMLAEISYLGNLVHKIPMSVSRNMIPLVNGRGPAQQSQALRPFPQFSGLTQNSATIGNSTYHALNAKIEKRFSSGLSYMMHYTWSKFIDDSPGSETVGIAANIQHIELTHLDKALSDNHQAHRYVASSVYDLPWGKGRKFDISNAVLNQIVGGWTVSTILELRSGPTIGVIENLNTSNTFSTTQRPHLIGDPVISADRTRGESLAQWFDTSAFVAPAVGEFGSAPRSFCCGPGFIGVDLSVQKSFLFTERWRLTFRSDFLNLPNRPNFWAPAGNRGRADFGRVSAILPGSTGRQIQFALRLEF